MTIKLMRVLAVAAAVAVTSFDAAPVLANSRLYGEVTLSDLEEIFRDLGMKTEDRSTPEFPILQVWQKGGAFSYSLNLYDCRGAQRYAFCKQLQFRAGWTLPKPPPLTQLNDFSNRLVFGRPLLQGNDLWVEYPFTIDGGVTRDNLVKHIELFDGQIEEFEKHFRKEIGL